MTRWMLMAQGVYYALTGAWPLVSMATFESVTGPKTDDWLVHMVGALAVAIGVTLVGSAPRRDPSSALLLAGAAAAAFASIDLVYALNGTISWVYLADAVLEILFLLGIAM